MSIGWELLTLYMNEKNTRPIILQVWTLWNWDLSLSALVNDMQVGQKMGDIDWLLGA